MIQLNLLPDVKLEYIKAQKMRSLVTGVSVIVTGVAIVILVIMLIVDFAQKQHISSLKNTINDETSALENKPNIGTILTVQNQLESLNHLYASRPAATRLFDTYLNEVTPETVSLNQFAVDFNLHTITLTGTADSLTTVNQYVDTLKLTTYSVSKSKQTALAFSGVVLSSFSLNSAAANPAQAASYTINLDFNPVIFDVTQNVNLTVPNITITHTDSSDLTSLFKAVTPSTSSTGGH